MKNYLILFVSIFFMMSCQTETESQATTEVEAPEFQNVGHELVYNMVQKTGSPADFFGKQNVEYTYKYETPDGKADVTTEKYIFDGELSYAMFKENGRTLPELDGTIEQAFDGENYWLKHNGESIDDEQMLGQVKFGRPTNYYWFAMYPKLLDPGLTYEHKGVKTLNGKDYDVVSVAYTNDDKAKDVYELHINQRTGLVDQFLFTVAEFGLLETPLLMEVVHENVDGLMIPTKRRYAMSTWDAELPEDVQWTNVTWSDIKFDTDMTKDVFTK